MKYVIIIVVGIVIFAASAPVFRGYDYRSCTSCGGNGEVVSTKTCHTCKGRGLVKCTYSYVYEDRTWLLNELILRKRIYCEGGKLHSPDGISICPACNGSGLYDCSTCGGYGKIESKTECSTCGGDGEERYQKQSTFIEYIGIID